MKKIGKIGKINIEARKKIAEIAEDMNINYCELNFKGCMRTFGVAPAHKYPREWYRSKPELLSDYHQWIIGCQYCHQILDDRSKTTEEEKDEIFNQLRP